MDLRARVLQELATPHAETRFAQPYLVGRLADKAGCRPHEVWEVLWGLVGEGLVYIDPGQQSPDNWRWRLTQVGIAAATGGQWEPRDPEGYLRRLRQHSPAIDSAAVGYVEEALRAFNARCYLATSVMLGVASERVFDGLARSVVAALGSSASKLKRALDEPRVSQASRFEALRRVLAPRRSEFPEGLADTLTMDAVAELLRITRNDAGHPTGASVDEDTAYTHLQMAALYLQKMTTLQDYFEERAGDGASG